MNDAILRRRKASAKARPFMWITHKGKAMLPRDMATPHLFYTIRMLYNHSVAPVFRIGDFKRYNDVPKWPLSYRERAMTNLENEFLKRDDAEQSELDEYNDMLANGRVACHLDGYR